MKVPGYPIRRGHYSRSNRRWVPNITYIVPHKSQEYQEHTTSLMNLHMIFKNRSSPKIFGHVIFTSLVNKTLEWEIALFDFYPQFKHIQICSRGWRCEILLLCCWTLSRLCPSPFSRSSKYMVYIKPASIYGIRYTYKWAFPRGHTADLLQYVNNKLLDA